MKTYDPLSADSLLKLFNIKEQKPLKATCDLCGEKLEVITDSYCSEKCMEKDEAMNRGEYEMQQQRDEKYE